MIDFRAFLIVIGLVIILMLSDYMFDWSGQYAKGETKEVCLSTLAQFDTYYETGTPTPNDAWGTPVKLREVKGSRWVTSAGPDKTFGTKDDMGVQDIAWIRTITREVVPEVLRGLQDASEEDTETNGD